VRSAYGWPTIALAALAALSLAADWRRYRALTVDRSRSRTGWAPWPLITVLALIATAFCAAAWLRDG